MSRENCDENTSTAGGTKWRRTLLRKTIGKVIIIYVEMRKNELNFKDSFSYCLTTNNYGYQNPRSYN